MSAGLRIERLAFRYGDRSAVRDLTLELDRGAAAVLLGPNGAGKSTLLHLLSGTLRPASGAMSWGDKDLATMPRRARAQRLALVPQVFQVPFAFSCRELVALARTPYVAPFGRERARDRAAVARALEMTETAHLADRSILELSGGERQRVLLAMALAQEPELLLLDEPTAQLDVAHQVAVLELVLERCERDGLTVLVAMHDLNLAALFFKRVIVLDAGRIVADGHPRAVLTSGLLRNVYAAETEVVSHPVADAPLVALVRRDGKGP